MPIGRPLGFTSTLIDAGRFPELGVIVTHCVPKGATDVVNAAVPLEDLTFTTCAAGSAAPSCHTNDSEAGVGVKVGVVCAIADTARKR